MVPIDELRSRAQWTKSSFSGGMGNCVEFTNAVEVVGVRDSKDVNGPILRFAPGEWSAFVAGVRSGSLG
ncbi:DUF397 domain-containing protein [Allonocardiopsis opalescens]|uniref:Uncharacterized protein DUF397 n=1 Tax=Allonocardiopsis opalescens TaxID=1144618 RepID=A0A2T0QC97_9ACTN|nr:DUF397 domain-containing protein [Allonocardiopsis opalescens]PRY01574.1 uncharacterized protein DUF397 [Allonocardiopsis opalescens]